jgi:phosphate transport system substrate-binding protein
MKINPSIKLSSISAQIYCLLFFIFLLGCEPEAPKEMVTKQNPLELKGTIEISGAEALYPLMQIWAAEFMKDKPDLIIQVTKGSTDEGLDKLFAGQTNLAMASRNLMPEEEAKGLWYITVSKEGIIPVINDNNPYLHKINTQGISRTTLRELFTSKTPVYWGDLYGVKKEDPIQIFIRTDISGTAEVWANYLGVDQKALEGTIVSDEFLKIEAVRQHPLSLSFCNAHMAYDLQLNKIKEGLSVLPIDINKNGMIDGKEQFYKELCMLQRAAYLGKYPSHLCRDLDVVTIGKPTKPEIIYFLKWILTDGQILASKTGYAEIRHWEANAIIQLLNEQEK